MNPENIQPRLTIKSAKSVDYETWHKRLGHPSKEILSQLDKNVNGYQKMNIPKEKQ